MEKFTVGTIVLVAFPFSNLKGRKVRPAMVLALSEFDNLILCQVTSREYSSRTAIKLLLSDFKEGSLPVVSFVRPDKIFTADKSIVKGIAGKLRSDKRDEVLRAVSEIFVS